MALGEHDVYGSMNSHIITPDRCHDPAEGERLLRCSDDSSRRRNRDLLVPAMQSLATPRPKSVIVGVALPQEATHTSAAEGSSVPDVSPESETGCADYITCVLPWFRDIILPDSSAFHCSMPAPQTPGTTQARRPVLEHVLVPYSSSHERVLTPLTRNLMVDTFIANASPDEQVV